MEHRAWLVLAMASAGSVREYAKFVSQALARTWGAEGSVVKVSYSLRAGNQAPRGVPTVWIESTDF